jgi:hypothetical protein
MQRAQSFNRLAGAHSHGSLSGLYNKNSTLICRDLQSLVQDPDTAKGPRLALLEQAEDLVRRQAYTFTPMSVVAWSFSLLGVILDPDILHGTANSSYLHQSAQFFGATAAMTEARRATLGQHLQKRISIAPSVMEDPKPGSLPDFKKKPEEKPREVERTKTKPA